MRSTSGFGFSQETRAVADKAERVASSKGGERIARIGLATKGATFLMIGVLAGQAALNNRGNDATTKGAIVVLGAEPFGKVLLVIAGVGLAAYGLFLAVQSVLDTDHVGHGVGAVLQRVGDFIAAVSYGTLAAFAFELVLGRANPHDTTEADTHDWTAKIMSLTAGRYIVGIIGLVVIAIGIGQLVTAYRARFRKNFDRSHLPPRWKTAVVTLGRIGYVARGVVYSTIGFFIAKAALHHDSRQVRGFQGALAELQALSYGRYVLGGVAIGLCVFGVYCFVDARYRCVFPHRRDA